MMLITYMKSTIREIIGGTLMIVFACLMFLFLPDQRIDWRDFSYLTILLTLTFLTFWFVGFFIFKKRYAALDKSLREQSDIDVFMPTDTSFYSTVIKGVAEHKNCRIRKEKAHYELSINEKNEYIAQWAHEVKLPIAVCELILNGEQGFNASKEKLLYELERINYLVGQVLYSARAADASQSLDISQFNVKNTLRQAIKVNSPFFIHNNIALDFSAENETVTSDEKWLAYILTQILHNAAKYTTQDGTVRVWTEKNTVGTAIHIWNEGAGICQEDLSKIFDKGFVGSTGRKQEKSTGLGLYLAQKSSYVLGIRLEVMSEENRCAEFVVTIPKD